jgi:diguanylate cyclase (GGDEF)-like protein
MRLAVGCRKKDSVLLSLFVVVYFSTIVLQLFVPSFFVGPVRYGAHFDSVKMQLIAVSAILIGVLQFLLSVVLVTLCRRNGYFVQIILNVVNCVVVVLGIVLFQQYIALPGIIISFAAIGTSTILFRVLEQLDSTIEKLHSIAFIDELTGLPNRKERIMLIGKLITGTESLPAFSIILFDIDNFKMINDSLGHQTGDELLKQIAVNFQDFLKPPVTIGRFGGDEFLITVPGDRTEADLTAYASRLSAVLSEPFLYKNHEYRITASFGVARYPKNADTAVELLQQVELALYNAKSQGKNGVVFFNGEMQRNLERRLCMERELRAAIEKKELYVEYQPAYTLPERRLRGFEVLVRWESPLLGLIPPLDFIPLAEENGTITAIGRWILETACIQYMKVVSEYEIPPVLSVNISVVQFRDPDFVVNVKRVLDETGMDPENLELEITESVCITSPEMTKRILSELKKIGIRIALDDFGTGYSSLSYLRTLPFDVVKIDKSFIDTIGIIPDEQNIVRTIIRMAHQLELKVIAEGVEADDQLEYLARYHCDYIQGNYLGKPAPISAL